MKKEKKNHARFKMSKERHKKTVEKAMKENKADKILYPLLKFFVKTKNYFTASSCAGRILLLARSCDGFQEIQL